MVVETDFSSVCENVVCKVKDVDAMMGNYEGYVYGWNGSRDVDKN